jgi:hypothetical protein
MQAIPALLHRVFPINVDVLSSCPASGLPVILMTNSE